VLILAICLPLLATLSTSFGEAKEVCYERNLAKITESFENNRSPQSEYLGGEGWHFDDINNRHLFPLHLFNSLSSAVSLVSFLTWLFCSPHTTPATKELDRACESESPSVQ
jgi:hypothetical protein